MMRFLIFLLTTIVVSLSCSKHNAPLDRVGVNYFDKAQFNPNWESGLLSPEWYARMTVVDTPVNSQALSIEDGNWLHVEKIRFEITENYLIGWRAHASVPGTENDSTPGGKENYKGAAVVAFKILSHFDVTPNYDSTTGTKGNLIIENKIDQSWYKRRFMRIDFGKNVVKELGRQDEAAWLWGSENITTDNSFAIAQNDPSNPKRSRFENGYFEITTRQGVKADILGYYGDYGDPFQMDSSSPVFDIRYSFMRKPERSNYQPLNYTDKLFDQFGFYRTSFTGQQKWNPFRGSLESNKNYSATRFNIWNEDGSPKPIVYYTSVSHPRNLMNASRRVESEWNQIFKQLVFEVKKGQYKSLDDVPNMWVLRENNCNINNVGNLLTGDLRTQVEDTASVKLDDIRARLDAANDPNSEYSFTDNHNKEAVALGDLEKICAAFEYYTLGKPNEFHYQRSGDLRYNLMNLINKRVMTRWSGLGPMFADMDTGEIIQSQANVNLWYLDRRANQAVELMNMMTGKVKFKDLILGADVHKYMGKKMKQIQRESEISPPVGVVHPLIGEVETLPAGDVPARLGAINSTWFLPKIFVETFDPLADFEKKQKRFHEQSQTFADPPEFLDNLVFGTALQYKNEEPKKRFLKIRESVYVATMLHEIGHNMGLTHNMSGSSDALNYGPQFWKIQSWPSAIKDAYQLAKDQPEIQKMLLDCAKESKATWGFLVKTQDCFRQPEFMYSSIMDYHASWNSDLAGLGTYDKAAIFFGYGQLVEAFPEANLTEEVSGKNLDRWLELNDWRKIPTHLVQNANQINERNWVKYDENTQLKNRVPYRFCIDSSGSFGPFCKAFDFGADMRTRAARNKTQYWQHYFLTHFARDRIWGMGNDLSAVVSGDLQIFEDFNQIMRWYGFYLLKDPDFKNSDAAKDYLAASIAGLNHYSHVLGHPISGEHVTTLENPNLMKSVDDLDSCALDNATIEDDKGERTPAPGNAYTTVMLGDGRPFAFGLNNDYEDYHLSYVGSFYSKLLAGYFLALPASYFPRVDPLKDSRLFKMSWYRLFPDEVSDLFSKLIRSDWAELGPLVAPDGELIHRDILDPRTLSNPDYTGLTPVMPAVADMLPYRSLFYASALLSIPQMTEQNVIHSMQIGVEGASDDRKAAYEMPGEMTPADIMVFEYPATGERYWAKKAGSSSISYDYLVKLNRLKEKVKKLENTECSFLETSVIGDCCSTKHPICKKAFMRPCTQKELAKELERAKVELENAVGFANDMRWIVGRYNQLR